MKYSPPDNRPAAAETSVFPRRLRWKLTAPTTPSPSCSLLHQAHPRVPLITSPSAFTTPPQYKLSLMQDELYDKHKHGRSGDASGTFCRSFNLMCRVGNGRFGFYKWLLCNLEFRREYSGISCWETKNTFQKVMFPFLTE